MADDRKPMPGLGAGWPMQRLTADLLVLLALFAWWLTSLKLPERVFPSPLAVTKTLASFPFEADFWMHMAMSGLRVMLAVVLATVIGSVVALLPRYFDWTASIVDDVLVVFFSAFPGIVWGILGAIWFGFTFHATVIVEILIILPYSMVNVSEGIKTIGKEEVEMGRSFTRNRLAVFWRVELPLLRPFIVAGARISYGVCWKVALVAELFGAQTGLGYVMQMAQELGQVDRIIAVCLVIVLIVGLSEWLIFRPLTRRFAIAPAATKQAAGNALASGNLAATPS